MTYRGRVQDGVVVLLNPRALPEGTEVEVTPVPPTTQEMPATGRTGEALEKLAGQAEGLPPDLAERHDHYRRERPS